MPRHRALPDTRNHSEFTFANVRYSTLVPCNGHSQNKFNNDLPCGTGSTAQGFRLSSLHAFRRADPQQGETVAQHLACGAHQSQARITQRRVIDQELLRVVITVKSVGDLA